MIDFSYVYLRTDKGYVSGKELGLGYKKLLFNKKQHRPYYIYTNYFFIKMIKEDIKYLQDNNIDFNIIDIETESIYRGDLI